MSGRFAAVKAGTKNRFGSALQAAKEKGKVAAENRRRRIQERGDQNGLQTHDASSDPFNAGVEAQSILTANPSQLRSIAIPLSEETTGNEEPTSVDLKGAPQSVHENDLVVGREGQGFESSMSMESDELVSENRMTSSGPARGQQLKSKLGAAVQSVRRGGAQDTSIRRRFGASNREESNDSRFLDPSSTLKLRGIHVGHGNPVDNLNGELGGAEDVCLETIRGRYWVATVAAFKRERTKSVSLDSTNAVGQITPSVSRGSSQATSKDESTDVSSTAALENAKEDGGDDHDEATVSDRQRRLENAFTIRMVSGNYGKSSSDGETDGETSEVVRSLADLLSLQTALSDCVSRVILAAAHTTNTHSIDREDDQGEAKCDRLSDKDMNSLDSVRFTGRLLRGLVETGSNEFEHEKEYNDYQCELVKEFLNLTLDTPLPQDGIEAISLFLECPGMTTGSCRSEQEVDDGVDKLIMKVVPADIGIPIASSQEILACTVACENDLVRLETQGSFAIRPVVVTTPKEEPDPTNSTESHEGPPLQVVIAHTPFMEPLLPFEITESLQGAMHEALMKIMEERDESHAQLIAASVLHVHEIEQERKRVDRLTQQLEASQARVKEAQMQNVTGNFFADKKLPEPNRASSKSKLSAMQEQVIQNSEQEMLNLCQQLASEISAKTSASLEIIRLKESRKIEQENEQAEKMALQDELKRCKELLAMQEQKTSEAKQTAEAWKAAYEKLKGRDEHDESE